MPFSCARNGLRPPGVVGVKNGNTVHAVSVRGSNADLTFRSVIVIRFGGTTDGGGLGLRGGWHRHMPGRWLYKVVRVRRHLHCPDFATRFVSAFFFRARRGATARSRGGLRTGGAVYAVSACGPAAAAAFRETFLQDASEAAGQRGLRASAAAGAALCQEDYYIRLFDLFAMDPMFHAVIHACHEGHRPGRCLESDDREWARRKRHKIMHDSLFPSHLRLCPCAR